MTARSMSLDLQNFLESLASDGPPQGTIMGVRVTVEMTVPGPLQPEDAEKLRFYPGVRVVEGRKN